MSSLLPPSLPHRSSPCIRRRAILLPAGREPYAFKMSMRPERETEEHRDPCLGQTDSRYAEGPLWESGTVPENASPHRRVEAQKCSGDDYASRLVARHARAIQLIPRGRASASGVITYYPSHEH